MKSPSDPYRLVSKSGPQLGGDFSSQRTVGNVCRPLWLSRLEVEEEEEWIPLIKEAARHRTPPRKMTTRITSVIQSTVALAYFSLVRVHGGVRRGGCTVTHVHPLGGRDLYSG